MPLFLTKFLSISLFSHEATIGGKYHSMQNDILYYHLCKVIASSNIEMWMSKEEMEAEFDYEKKDKVVQEEEESWGKLCSKLVSKILQL